MPLPLQNVIRIDLNCLQKLIVNWSGDIEKSFSEEKEGNRIEVLETIHSSLLILRLKLNSDIDRLIDKVQKEIASETRLRLASEKKKKTR